MNSVMSQSACNTAGQLSPRDIVGVRVAYGQRPAGSIVGPGAQCLDVPPGSPSGTQAQFFGCNLGSNQKWRRDGSFRLHLPSLSNSFLDVRGGSFSDFAVVQTFSAINPVPTNQQWRLNNAEIVGLGGLCTDVPGGNFVNGQLLQVFTCNGGSNQRWNIGPDGRISNGSFCWDVPGGNTASGTRIQIYQCYGGANQAFSFTSSGQITFGGKCIDVVGGQPNNGSQLQLFSCKGESDTTRFNQKFHASGPLVTGGSFCLDVPGGDESNNTGAQIFTCHGGPNQKFDVYLGF
jgi:hypothetical protein